MRLRGVAVAGSQGCSLLLKNMFVLNIEEYVCKVGQAAPTPSPALPFVAHTHMHTKLCILRSNMRSNLCHSGGTLAPCRAIALAVVRSFTLWQGPPGTGKTRTLLALVEVCVVLFQYF